MKTITLHHLETLNSYTSILDDDRIEEMREWAGEICNTFENTDEAYYWMMNNQKKFPFKDDLIERIKKLTNNKFERVQFWIQFYHWYDFFHPHSHDDGKTNLCGIIFLDDVGKTHFICNTGKERPVETVSSSSGKMVTFPVDMLHYVMPHCDQGKMRYTLCFNSIIKEN